MIYPIQDCIKALVRQYLHCVCNLKENTDIGSTDELYIRFTCMDPQFQQLQNIYDVYVLPSIIAFSKQLHSVKEYKSCVVSWPHGDETCIIRIQISKTQLPPRPNY